MKPHIWLKKGWWHCSVLSRIGALTLLVGYGSTPASAYSNWRAGLL